MNIYEKYSDKTIRNKSDKDELERALTDTQVADAADRIIAKYRSEPTFLMEVTGKLIDRLRRQAPKSTTGDHHNEV